jgi:hypothetical protein
MAALDDVFGISVKPVLSYTERAEVDGLFREALTSDRLLQTGEDSASTEARKRQRVRGGGMRAQNDHGRNLPIRSATTRRKD